MKRFIIYCLVLICLIFPFNLNSVVAEEGKIIDIINGDFIERETHKSIFGTRYTPKNWSTGEEADIPFVRWTDETAYSGSSCIYFLSAGQDVNLSGDKILLDGGRNYRFGFKVKNAECSNIPVQMKIHAYNINGDKVCEYVSETNYSLDDWQDVFVEFTLSAFAVSIVPVISVEVKDIIEEKKTCFVDYVYGVETKSACDIFSVTDGASLRLVKDSPGIRFEAKINKDAYDKYVKTYQSVSAGMIIVPTESLKSLSDFTVEELDANDVLYVTIKASKWYNEKTVDADGEYKFYCALINILDKNIERAFSVRAYISYEKDGKICYDYSLYNESVNSRSVKETAIRAKEKIADYNETQAEIINYYANFQYET